jgi:hypothetical protein
LEPVKPEWIIGVAQQPPIPWIGNLRLALPFVVNPLTTASDQYQRFPIFNVNRLLLVPDLIAMWGASQQVQNSLLTHFNYN